MRGHALLRQLRCSASTSRRLRYEHGFHAGSYVDVTKHAILSLLMLRMAEKSSPFTFVDTHAGAGLYPLDASMEQSTGVGRLRANLRDSLPPALSAFSPISRASSPCRAAAAPGGGLSINPT